MKYHLFIRRPILSCVIAMIIVLLGIAAVFNLPVEQYPNISPPSISISTQYPGASAETIERSISAQIENQLNGVSNLLYMSSNSSGAGGAQIRLTFEVGTDLNYAVNDVLNRVHAAMPLLPSIVQKLGVIVRKSSPDMLLSLRFFSSNPSLDTQYMNNYLQRTVYNDLSIVPGVGQISLNGARNYAIRIWLDINKMNALNIAPADVSAVIQDQNQQYTVGQSAATANSVQLNISGSDMYTTPEQFGNIVIRTQGTQIIRVKDVARVELGAQSYNTVVISTFKNVAGKVENRNVLNMQIFMDPSANQLEVKQLVLDRLATDVKSFPTGLEYYVAFDATQFVSNSIDNVLKAMRDASILVALVILLFLHNWRASLIALITIPVSIVGSFACLYMLGYSINTLTLFATILAIGIVVDDAIVVVENIERIKVQHPDHDLRMVIELAMREVFSAIVAISLVLSVVFLPVLALSGLSGVLYKQFAVTIACSVILSAICAIVLTPALSGLLLKKRVEDGKFSRKFNQLFDAFSRFYIRIAGKIIDIGKYSLGFLLVALIATFYIFKLVPTSFMPNEDQGYFFAGLNLPITASLDATKKQTMEILADVVKMPGVKETTSIVGIDKLGGGGPRTSATTLQVMLNNWSDRTSPKQSVDALVAAVNKLNSKYKDVKIKAYNQPPIRGLSTTGGVEFYLEDRANGDSSKLQSVANQLNTALMKHPEVKLSYSLLNTNVEQIVVDLDVDRAKYYDVAVANTYNTLQAVYSTSNVNFAYLMQGLVWVIMQADYPFRNDLNRLSNIYVKNNNNIMVPIENVVKVRSVSEADIIERFNDYLATKITVMPNNGYTSGDVMKIIQQEMTKLPNGYGYDWFGTSFQQVQSQLTTVLVLSFSIIMIYLLLCALYEMWRLPLVVLMGVPFALFGAGVMLLIRGQSNDLYFQISLLTLLGLSAKNIILLIEFALVHMQNGHSAKDSALHALKLRLRPIVMTSITFIMGAIPLVLASGAGANAEHSVGSGIIGGMLGSMLLATLVVPSFFVLVMKNYKFKG